MNSKEEILNKINNFKGKCNIDKNNIETLNNNLVIIQQLIRKLLTVIRNTSDEIKV